MPPYEIWSSNTRPWRKLVLLYTLTFVLVLPAECNALHDNRATPLYLPLVPVMQPTTVLSVKPASSSTRLRLEMDAMRDLLWTAIPRFDPPGLFPIWQSRNSKTASAISKRSRLLIGTFGFFGVCDFIAFSNCTFVLLLVSLRFAIEDSDEHTILQIAVHLLLRS